jgi:hypothetical protein
MPNAVYAYMRPEDQASCKVYRNISLGDTGVVIKASAGHVYNCLFTNTNATNFVFVRLYDIATVPTGAGSTAQLVATIPVPPGVSLPWGSPYGIKFATGIAIRASTAVADADGTNPSANQVICNVLWS